MKLYSEEPGSDAVRAAEPLIVSALAEVEITSALWRKHRMGELDPADAALLAAAAVGDLHGTKTTTPRFVVVALVPEMLRRATRLVAVHPLRAYDAVQLATALVVRDAGTEGVRFACFDRTLSAAAVAEGLVLVG